MAETVYRRHVAYDEERKRRTRGAIISACRELMRAGIYRPSASFIARTAMVDRSRVRTHFRNLDTLYTVAFECPRTFFIVKAVGHVYLGVTHDAE